MLAIVPHNTFRLACRAGGQRIERGSVAATVTQFSAAPPFPSTTHGHGPRSARKSVVPVARCGIDFVCGDLLCFVEQWLVGNDLPRLNPPDAERITFGPQSSIRVASSLAANPPKTTEWTAPRRHRRAWISPPGIIGMYTITRSPLPTLLFQNARAFCNFVTQLAVRNVFSAGEGLS